MRNRVCATLVLMLLATACATTRLRSGFDDIPLPTGLTYESERSVVIESPTVKAAKLVYRGRLEPASLGLSMRTLLESNGWRHVNTTTEPKDGTRQVYEKGGNALEVHIYEGLWFTYLTLGVSETLLASTTATNPTAAGMDASVRTPPAQDTSPGSDRTAGPQTSFAQRVRDFFSNLFSR
jgi:hypothetical protein